MTDTKIDTSSEVVERAVKCVWFITPESGAAETAALLRALAADRDALRAALDEREAELARLKQWLLGESAHIVGQWDAGYDAAIRAMLRQLGATP